MKVTEENGKIIIDFETKEDNTDKIIALLKDYEEDMNVLSESHRAMGLVGSAVICEVRADTTRTLIRSIVKTFK